MKVALIGASGVFGSRLARMLSRDGHDLILAGRRLAPLEALKDEVGGKVIAIDRGADLSPLWGQRPEVVVDAAGPFHAYGNDPYALARAAIEHRCHYLDLSDNADFCAGITALNAQASAAARFALSGVSSVPGLSSAVVAELARDCDEIAEITSAILPGNRAPSGQSVIASILDQAGREMTHRVAGQDTPYRSWSSPRDFYIGQGETRKGYLISVPDQALFPDYFGAPTVRFYAGLDLGVSNAGLAVASRLRAWTGMRLPDALYHGVARLLEPLGHDSGGMVVQITARKGETWLRRDWTLHVSGGEGPFIPGTLVRAILRQPERIAAGARPALGCLPLADIEPAWSDLNVETAQNEQKSDLLFPRVLGERFEQLPQLVQDSHATVGPLRLVGEATITRGTGLWPRIIATLFRFPPATKAVPVTVLKEPVDGAEVWHRHFGSNSFQSRLASGPRGMTERFGPFTFDLDLHVADGALHFPVRAGRLWGIPLPKWALPESRARETEDNGTFRFDVALHAPLTGQLIVHYRGHLRPTDRST